MSLNCTESVFFVLRLRLLTIWLKYGSLSAVQQEFFFFTKCHSGNGCILDAA